jgi:hypothetical protein
VRNQLDKSGKSCAENHVGLNECAETGAAGFSDIPQMALCYRNGPFVSSGLPMGFDKRSSPSYSPLMLA